MCFRRHFDKWAPEYHHITSLPTRLLLRLTVSPTLQFLWECSGELGTELLNKEEKTGVRHSFRMRSVSSDILLFCTKLNRHLTVDCSHEQGVRYSNIKTSFIRVKEQRNILHEIRKRKANWIGHILRRNCLLRRVTEGKIQGETEVTGREGRRRRKLLDDLKGRRGYSHLKEEALDRTMWRARFGRGFEPVVRQTTKWINTTYLSRRYILILSSH